MANLVDLYQSGPLLDHMISSLSLQLADCQIMGHNIHFAAVASCMAEDAGWKTHRVHKQHLRVHTLANYVKHNLFDLVDMKKMLPPMPIGIEAADLEASRADQHSIERPLEGNSCMWCGLWMPLLDTYKCVSIVPKLRMQKR
jgi:hypothetical protein